jgi:hypothetical protein
MSVQQVSKTKQGFLSLHRPSLYKYVQRFLEGGVLFNLGIILARGPGTVPCHVGPTVLYVQARQCRRGSRGPYSGPPHPRLRPRIFLGRQVREMLGRTFRLHPSANRHRGGAQRAISTRAANGKNRGTGCSYTWYVNVI